MRVAISSRNDDTREFSMIGCSSEKNVLRKRGHGLRTVLPRSASFPAGGTSDYQNKQKGARMWLKVLRQNISHLARRAKGNDQRCARFSTVFRRLFDGYSTVARENAKWRELSSLGARAPRLSKRTLILFLVLQVSISSSTFYRSCERAIDI